MAGPLAARAQQVPTSEQVHLEEAHYELCTALTSLRSNVALMRTAMPADGTATPLRAHLTEVDEAVDRLQRLAHAIRLWRQGPAV